MLGIALRILTVATFFIGLGLLTGTIGGDLWRWLHLVVGVGIVILAILVLGPWVREATTAGIMGRIAWWSPLVAIALGLVLFGERLGLWSSGVRSTVITVHVIVGIVVVGLIEMALGQMRRAANAAEQSQEDTPDTTA